MLFDMRKLLLCVLIMTLRSPAWAQMQHGTVIYFDFSQDDLTIAADSRTGAAGRTVDTECKISAFGDQFIFAVSGLARRTTSLPSGSEVTKWTAQSIARSAWQTATSDNRSGSAPMLVAGVAAKWLSRMENNFASPDAIRLARPYLAQSDEHILAEGLFAATDKAGNLSMKAATIFVDLPLFDSTGQIRLWHETYDGKPDTWGSTGYDEVVEEFKRRTSERARQYMQQFEGSISALTKSEQRASLAAKLIELSILYHPKKEILGPPIDVLQLVRGSGVHWIHRKESCPVE
jgi:hypothetical protein